MQITDADREAAEDLRVLLADASGFWHNPGDEGPLCIALARHRLEAERRIAEALLPIRPVTAVPRDRLAFSRANRLRRRPRRTVPEASGGRTAD